MHARIKALEQTRIQAETNGGYGGQAKTCLIRRDGRD